MTADLRGLQPAIDGDVVLPGSPDYESVRKPVMARLEHLRPAAVVRCASPADVAATLAVAGRLGLPTAIRSGGHSVAGRSSTDGVVLDLTPMGSVGLAGEVATVGAGGGHFGVVTSLVFRTLPAPVATVFQLAWPPAAAAAVMGAWQAWAPDGPDELDATLRLTAVGDGGRLPGVEVVASVLDGEADATELLGELVGRVGADPVEASRRRLPHRAAKRYLEGLGSVEGQLERSGPERPPPPGHLSTKSEFFRRPLPGETVAALVERLAQGLAPGQSREVDFLPWGGAYNRVPADATGRLDPTVLSQLVSAQTQLLATCWPPLPNSIRPSATGWASIPRSACWPDCPASASSATPNCSPNWARSWTAPAAPSTPPPKPAPPQSPGRRGRPAASTSAWPLITEPAKPCTSSPTTPATAPRGQPSCMPTRVPAASATPSRPGPRARLAPSHLGLLAHQHGLRPGQARRRTTPRSLTT